ncbi:MAG: BlaI/MecI/CopY family transcriptional regulator [Gemmatimonadetes bacterium]|nr:BlaI/MecI/CopY family transcriptional regulator [Gemmatimonadota bacterium]
MTVLTLSAVIRSARARSFLRPPGPRPTAPGPRPTTHGPSTEKPVDSQPLPAHTTGEPVAPRHRNASPRPPLVTDYHFPPRELAVMSVLWRLESATVAEVREHLDEDLAYTSVLSALQILEEKGYVRHEPEGRAYRYFPTVAADRAGKSAITRIKDAIFHGSTERLFAQLVSDRKLGRDELERMRALLAERLGDDDANGNGNGGAA